MKMEYIAYALLVGAGVYILYRIVKQGFKGALFNGKILKTYGEMKTLPVSAPTNKIRIHEIEGKSGNDVGIEITGPFEMTPVKLSKDDVPKLISLLEKTLEGSQQENA